MGWDRKNYCLRNVRPLTLDRLACLGRRLDHSLVLPLYFYFMNLCWTGRVGSLEQPSWIEELQPALQRNGCKVDSPSNLFLPMLPLASAGCHSCSSYFLLDWTRVDPIS